MTDFPVVSTGENVTCQVFSDHKDLMVAAFRFAAEGAIGALRNQPPVQSTYVENGRFHFTSGNVEREVGLGDSFVIPSGQMHGYICLEPSMLVDCFTPRRDDFL